MNGKIDPRTEKTRNYLAESLLTLMKDKPLSRITVKDLCQQAGVNRTTFYAHYKDVKELLEEVESVLLSDIQKNLAAGLSSGSTMEDMLTNLLDTIKQNSDLCFILLGKNGDMEFLGKALYWAEEATLQSWQRAYPNRNSRVSPSCIAFCPPVRWP